MADSSTTSGSSRDDPDKAHPASPPSMPRIDPYEARHIPYVRLNRVGLELLVSELDRLGKTKIETATLKNIESIDAFSGYKSSALQGPPDVVVGGGEGWQHAYPRGDLVGETVRRQVDEVVSERSE